VYAGKLRELVKKQGVDRAALSPPAFFALAKFNCPRAFVAALTEEQLELASSCGAWFVFEDAGLAMVPLVGAAEKAKAAHALECVNMFGNFVAELSPRCVESYVEPSASIAELLSWRAGDGDAGAGGSGAAGLLDSAAAAERALKGKRPM
jgi:hypothetical protein